MHLRIHDIAAKADWLAKIAAFLHDARIHQRFAYDEATLTFALPLHRIGYEFRTQRRALWFFTAWSMPEVPSTLSLAPVQIATIKESVDAWTGWGEQLVAIQMVTPTEIEILTREAVVHLRSQGQVALLLTDTGPPGARTHTDYGGLIVPEEVVSEIVNTEEA